MPKKGEYSTKVGFESFFLNKTNFCESFLIKEDHYRVGERLVHIRIHIEIVTIKMPHLLFHCDIYLK